MLIPLGDLVERYSMKIDGVLHVGAHLGEEADAYARYAFGEVTWIEGNSALIGKLKRNVAKYNHHVINAIVADYSGYVEFHITNNGESSSILELGTHLQTSPQVFVTETIVGTTFMIDELYIPHAFNFLNLDLQGAELLALKGMPQRLKGVDYIYTEVNKRAVYKNCVQYDELDRFLKDFTRIETMWCTDRGVNHGWGDAIYLRNT